MAVPAPTATAVVVAEVPDTVITPVLLLTHAPVPLELRTVLLPLQRESAPEILSGAAKTVTTVSVKQPPGAVYLMVLVPVATEPTTPVAAPMVATAVLLLAHVPPDGDDANVAVLPRQIPVVPVMVVGKGLTVTTCVLKQPVDASTWVTIAVPAERPLAVVVVAVPDTVTTAVLLLVHAPVPVEVSKVLLPAHTDRVPVISAGAARTVTTACKKQPPGAV